MYFLSNLKYINMQLDIIVLIASWLISFNVFTVTMIEGNVDPNATTVNLISHDPTKDFNTRANSQITQIHQSSWQNSHVFINITMTMEVISACTTGHSRLRFRAKKGSIYVKYQPDSFSIEDHIKGKKLLSGTCLLEIEVILPTGMIMNFMIENLPAREEFSNLSVYDSPDYPSMFTTWRQRPFLTNVTSFTNDVIFEFTSKLSHAFTWLLQIDGIIKTSKHNLEILYTSPKHGIVQISDWNGEPLRLIDSWVRVPVLASHSVLVSVFKLVKHVFSCSKYGVHLYTVRNEGARQILNACVEIKYPIVISQVSAFYVRFQSPAYLLHIGFQMNFSYHIPSVLSKTSPGGRWNCSLWSQVDIHHHLSCDLSVQCLNGEDERSCPYTSDKCGLGFITLGNDCFLYEMSQEKMTQKETNDQCLKHNARLPKLNTWEKWHYVTGLFTAGLVTSPIPLGVKISSEGLPHMYSFSWQWSDNSIAYFVNAYTRSSLNKVDSCGSMALDTDLSVKITPIDCHFLKAYSNFLCEWNSVYNITENTDNTCTLAFSSQAPPNIVMAKPKLNLTKKLSACPDGHFTQPFCVCDLKSACWVQRHAVCTVPLASFPPSFECENERESVPYTFVCDHRPDCIDSSDESFCVFEKCNHGTHVPCSNLQCVHSYELCDGVEQCVDGLDEKKCKFAPYYVDRIINGSYPPPAVLDFNGSDSYTVRPYDQARFYSYNASITCPDTHFLCPGTGYCLPVYVRCNGVLDCPGHEDEAVCASYTCPGFYHCRGSTVCLHTSHVCDGIFQCPRHDDELLCDAKCPENCTCHGLAFVCARPIAPHEFPDLRYVDAGHSLMTLDDFSSNTFLVYLSLEHCGLQEIDAIVLNNLRSLDLSNNNLTFIRSEVLLGFQNLKFLSLARNPLVSLDSQSRVNIFFPKLQTLNLSGVLMSELNVISLTIFPNLETLTLLFSRIVKVHKEGFNPLKMLRVLDLTGCPISDYPRDLFRNLSKLESLYADDFKLCCPVMLPTDTTDLVCHAPADEISSCGSLLRSNVYRGFTFVFALLALPGGFGFVVYRVFVRKEVCDHAFEFFLTHLFASDFLMGVYLVLIGVTDWTYQENYIWEDKIWKNSATCKMAGFLALVSKQTSALLLCLVICDHFVLLYFSHTQAQFRKRSAHFACTVAWCVGVALASLPFVPAMSHWNLYGQTDICIPLPITRQNFDGKKYSFFIMIILNFVLVFIDIIGLLLVYCYTWKYRFSSSRSDQDARMSKDVISVRRLISFALFNVLCWLPVVILGLAATTGTHISGEIIIAMATIILPLSPSLNPYLYLLNYVRERVRQTEEERRRKRILVQIKIHYNNVKNRVHVV